MLNAFPIIDFQGYMYIASDRAVDSAGVLDDRVKLEDFGDEEKQGLVEETDENKVGAFMEWMDNFKVVNIS